MNLFEYAIFMCFTCYQREFNISSDRFGIGYNDYLISCKQAFIQENSSTSNNSVPQSASSASSSSSESVARLRSCYLEHMSDEKDGGHELLAKLASQFVIAAANDTNSSTINSSSSSSSPDNSDNRFSAGRMDPIDYTYSTSTMTLLIILYTLTIVVSIVGNCLVIIVTCCGFKSSYLDISMYLCHLSIFNLLMAVFCLPFTVINVLIDRWVLSEFMCPLTNFFQMLSVNGCIMTLTSLAINRFLVVNNPLKYSGGKCKSIKRSSLIITWCASIGISLVQLFIYKCECSMRPIMADYNNHYPNPNLGSSSRSSLAVFSSNISSSSNHTNVGIMVERICFCKETWHSTDRLKSARYYLIYTIWIFIQTYFIPIVILISTSIRIIHVLTDRNRSGSLIIQMHSTNENFKTKTYKSIRVLIVIIGTFAINWLPIHVFYLMLSFSSLYQEKNPSDHSSRNKSLMTVFFFICHWISMSNSFINPIIYSFMTKTFRSDLRSLLNFKDSAAHRRRESAKMIINESRQRIPLRKIRRDSERNTKNTAINNNNNNNNSDLSADVQQSLLTTATNKISSNNPNKNNNNNNNLPFSSSSFHSNKKLSSAAV